MLREMEALEEEELLDEKMALPQVPKTKLPQQAAQETQKDSAQAEAGGRPLSPMLAS